MAKIGGAAVAMVEGFVAESEGRATAAVTDEVDLMHWTDGNEVEVAPSRLHAAFLQAYGADIPLLASCMADGQVSSLTSCPHLGRQSKAATGRSRAAASLWVS
jgi:hypothetical protein